LLDPTKETWKVIHNHYFDKIGGLSFISNSSAKKLSSSIPTFYREMLTFFQELRNDCEDPMQRNFILWNNKEITIENKIVVRQEGSLCPRYFGWLNGNFLPFNKFKKK